MGSKRCFLGKVNTFKEWWTTFEKGGKEKVLRQIWGKYGFKVKWDQNYSLRIDT